MADKVKVTVLRLNINQEGLSKEDAKALLAETIKVLEDRGLIATGLLRWGVDLDTGRADYLATVLNNDIFEKNGDQFSAVET